MTADTSTAIKSSGPKGVERWSVVALQLDLLDNKPTVAMRSSWGAEAILNPHQIVDSVETSRASIFGAGYLCGYSDRHFNRSLGAALEAAGLGTLLVPGG